MANFQRPQRRGNTSHGVDKGTDESVSSIHFIQFQVCPDQTTSRAAAALQSLHACSARLGTWGVTGLAMAANFGAPLRRGNA